jgi:hypothetical protein
MQVIRRAEMERGRSAALPSTLDRSGTAAGLRAGQWAGVFAAALIAIIMARPAMAAVCRVPADVLCSGCVERLSIRIMPGGACRVSFITPASSESNGAGKFVDIDVEAGPPHPARHRVTAPRLSAARPAAPQPPSAGCFLFNGRRFCE